VNATETLVRFTVVGEPIPQGSKSAYVRGGRAVIADDNKHLKRWRKDVTAAAAHVRPAEPIDGDLVVAIEFRLVQPKSVRRERPNVRPDVDKLIRSVFDGITDSGLWSDDARVVTVWASKVYAPKAGAYVRVGRYLKNEGTAA
jgi:Holliday junction resolvase RusA-like endonuclease